MTTKVLHVSLLVLAFSSSAPALSAPASDRIDARDEFFAHHTIPRLRIQLDAEALAALRNKFREYTKATIIEGTNTWREVGIHLKGQYGTFQGIDGRPSLTLNFDKYVKGQRFHGLDKLHLNNSAQDPGYLCEMIGRQLFEAAGVPTARASHARVELNGRDLGLFVLIEGFDRKFLKRHFGNADGNLYDSGFRHDITDPLKKGSGKGPDDHSDLLAIAAAAGEQDHAERLRQLSALVDMDRFYTALAMETLIRHHDGYSMGINNFWIYQNPESGEPVGKLRDSRREEAQGKQDQSLVTSSAANSAVASGRAVFMPHGMDQLFFEPRAGLLPDLRGLVSQAVLETQVGRSEFRVRCVTLYTNLFPSLSNRVEAARVKIRPMLAELEPKIAQHANEAATNLLYRIQERTAQLQRAVFLKPEVPRFNEQGVASLTNWLATTEGGRTVIVETNSAGNPVLQLRVSASEKGTIARWEKAVLLTAGTYRFSAKVTADQPVFRGPIPPVSLRIWGLSEVQMDTSRPDPQTMEFQSTFEVSLENAGEYLLQCDARSKELSVVYRFVEVELKRTQTH